MKLARSHGPVTSMPILPALNRSHVLGVRGVDVDRLVVDGHLFSIVSASSPCAELNAAFVLSGVRMSPPASQSIASQCQTVSSLPSAGIDQPSRLALGVGQPLAAARKSSHVQVGVGGVEPELANSFLL